MVKWIVALAVKLALMASFYICFLILLLPYIHTGIQENITNRILQGSSNLKEPFESCFTHPSSNNSAGNFQRSYEHSLGIGNCIISEAKGYIKIFKGG